MRSALFPVLVILWLWPSAVSAADAIAGCPLRDDLSHAAALLLLSADHDAPGAIGRALQEADSDLAGAQALLTGAGADDTAVEAWLQRQRKTGDADLVCGEARSAVGRLVVVAPLSGGLSPLDPESAVARGWLAPGFDRAELSIAAADGELVRLSVTAEALRRGVPLAEELARPALVQLLATGALGPRPIAQRLLPPRPGEAPQAPTPADARNVEGPVAGRLNRLRAHGGRSPLRRNRLLREAAQRHAHDVCRSGRVGHLSSEGTDPEQRLREAGIEARLVGETVARAGAPADAFEALRGSPSHLLTLLDERFTDAGVAFDQDGRGRSCLVVLLAAWPRFVGRIASR